MKIEDLNLSALKYFLDAVVALKVNDEILFSKMELSGSGSTLNGFDILIYKDLAIHATLKGDKNNPSLNLRFMAKGTPGNPAEVGSYSLSCK